MERKIRVAAVNYRNALPLVYGLQAKTMQGEIELMFDYPANIASMLSDDRADIGLLPVAVIPTLPEAYIAADYCIATDDEVASVCLFSQVPIASIESIYLDYQSRTSVALLQLLLKDYWKLNPGLIHAEPGFESQILGTTAGLVIGDRALEQRSRSAYIYDLGTAWKSYTGLPFVFAAWVANKQLPPDVLERFNEATGAGLAMIDEIAASQDFPAYDLNTYYTKNINFRLTEDKRKGLAVFLQKLSTDQ